MKITQDKAAFQPITIVFDNEVEFKELYAALKKCAACARLEDRGYSAVKVEAFASHLHPYIK